MKAKLLLPLLAGLIAGCETNQSLVTRIFTPDYTSPQEALSYYYNSIPDDALPVAPAGLALPAEDTVLDHILIGSCFNEEGPDSMSLRSIAREQADLFLMVGDNVYGDKRGPAYINNDADLPELRRSFALLAERPDFQALRASVPMLAAWDDHDYGANDMGVNFAFKEFAERIHEVFWGLDEQDVGHWPGTYYSRLFGPQGQRVQVIVLDTRFFRSDLTLTDEEDAPGKQAYLPAPDTVMQDVLGAVQWTWLENQLQAPADIRLVVSSIQVVPSVHGYESWSRLPVERQRLFELINRTEAKGVIFLSGDRHESYMYKQPGVLPYPIHELTASSLNLSFNEVSTEYDRHQIGEGYPAENYGAIAIDWDRRALTFSIKSAEGITVRQHDISFSDIGLDEGS